MGRGGGGGGGDVCIIILCSLWSCVIHACKHRTATYQKGMPLKSGVSVDSLNYDPAWSYWYTTHCKHFRLARWILFHPPRSLLLRVHTGERTCPGGFPLLKRLLCAVPQRFPRGHWSARVWNKQKETESHLLRQRRVRGLADSFIQQHFRTEAFRTQAFEVFQSDGITGSPGLPLYPDPPRASA